MNECKYTYKEESVREKCVSKDSPTSPSTGSSPPIQNFRDHKRNNHTDKLVTGIGHQIEQLRVVAYAQDIRPELETQDLNGHDDESGGRGQSHDLWVESSSKASQEGRK